MTLPLHIPNRRRLGLALLFLTAVACEEPHAANPVVQPSATVAVVPRAAPGQSSAPAAASAADHHAGPVRLSASTDVAAGQPCGALGCRHFDTAEAAFRAVLAHRPRVLAIGEAHAQRGTEGIASATARFRQQLLPMVKGQASDLVIELLVADGSCKKNQQKVTSIQRPVTKRQARGNQNEFAALGYAADDMGVRPHVLRPSCEDYASVVAAGADGIPTMLTMIARLTESLLIRILQRNQKAKQDKLVLAYGGAMHNDVIPGEGRESWSFGAAMLAATDQRYIALDLIVPEFIKDNDSWRKLPWHQHFDKRRAPDKTTLYRTGPASFTLIFSRTLSLPVAGAD